jgi:hypothetical protein
MVDRLDEERLEILRSWGIGLASDDREELRAAGKAITVLIDEIDRLQVDLWNSRAVEREGSDLVEPLMAAAQGTALRDRLTRHRPQV